MGIYHICATALMIMLSVPVASPLVIGIDLGSRFFKVGLLQPGKPYHIVMNIESKRKTSTALTLGGEERFFGNTAQGAASRRPLDTILLATTLLGRTEDEAAMHWVKSSLLPDQWYVDESRGTYRYRLSDGETTHSVEEVVAMVLQHAQEIASAAAGIQIKDAVLSVPPFYTQQQRLALLDAARISGLSVTGLINDNTATALVYGVEKDKQFRDAEEPRIVVFFDMGATSTRASVVRFHNTPSKLEKKANKTVGEYVVKGVAWDEQLGALSFDNAIMEKVASGFNEKRKVADGSDKDVRRFPKAVGKMRKAAEKAKEVLSTIPATAVTIEGLLDDTDFVMPITRDEMESMTSDLLDRVTAPVERALEQSGYAVEDVHSVEIVGGGSRIPCVQARLKALLGKELGVSLNGDDAVGLGATLFAAKESTSHRMRETVLKDGNPYAIDVRVVPVGKEEGDDTDEISREVFSELCRMPVNKKLSFSRTGDFEVYMDYSADASLPAGTSRAMSKFVVTGVGSALERYADDIVVEQEEGNDEDEDPGNGQVSGVKKSKVSLSMQLTKMGTVELFRYDGTITVKAPPPPKKEEPAPAPANDTVPDEAEVESKEDEAESKGDEAKNNDDEAAEGGAEAGNDSAESTSERPQQHKAGDAAEDGNEEQQGEDESASGKVSSGQGDPKAATADSEGQAKPKDVESAEDDKVKTKLKHLRLNVTAAERNSLLPLNTTQVAESTEVLSQLNHLDQKRRDLEAAKNSLETHLYATREFLYDAEGLDDVCTEQEKEQIMEELSKTEDWIYDEGANVELDVYEGKLEEIKKVSEGVRFRHAELTDRPQALAAARERVQHMLSKVDLWNSSKPWINATQKQNLVNKTLTYSEWLDTAEKEQSEASPFEDPVLTSADIARKISPIESSFRRLSKTPKPRPPRVVNATNKTRTRRNRTVSNSSKPTPEPEPEPPNPDASPEGEDVPASTTTDSPSADDKPGDGEKVKTEL